MRALAVGAAVLLLGGCDGGPHAGGNAPGAADANGAGPETPGSAFDYRYAFRLPAARIASVQESNAQGCDRLGPARCRITAMRYTVGDDNQVAAVLTLKIDPTLARPFGKAASATVRSAGGATTNADVAGADSVAATGRSDTVIARLRDALGNSEAQLRGTMTDEQRAQLSDKAERLRGAIATIGEIDQSAGGGIATTPVILTYGSSGAIPGVGASSDATFDNAGATFLSSLAGLMVLLAGVGPWAALLLGGALLGRWLLQGRETRADAPALPAAPRDGEQSRNVVQRWFGRDEHREPEHAD